MRYTTFWADYRKTDVGLVGELIKVPGHLPVDIAWQRAVSKAGPMIDHLVKLSILMDSEPPQEPEPEGVTPSDQNLQHTT